MLTQRKLDLMAIKAEEKGREAYDGWERVFLGARHPENGTPELARQPQAPLPQEGQVDNGRLGS